MGILLFILTAGAQPPEPPDQAALVQERDALIQKIIRGTDYEASVRRFVALYRSHERSIMDAETTAAQLRAVKEAQRAWREAYHKSADYQVSWRCTLSPDPKDPVPSDEGRFRGDWGRVVRREVVRLPPKNPLDAGEEWTMLEVKGEARSYLIHSDRYGLPDRSPLRAAVGDLVLVCDGGSAADPRLPTAWQTGPLQRSGFAVPITRPPLIAKKGRFAPVHITGSKFFWAIHDVRWKYEGRYVLSNIEVGKDLGGGRYEIDALQGLSWILEVPPQLPRQELLVPGRALWAILGKARFDPLLRKLVLVAEDLEERYVSER